MQYFLINNEVVPYIRQVFDFFTTYVGNGEVTGYVGDLVTTLKKTHNFT